MDRGPGLLCDPTKLLFEYKSIVSFLIPYSSSETSNLTPASSFEEEDINGFGRVARYAQGEDYHTVLRELLRKIVLALGLENTARFRLFSDSVPILERALASESELGFIGKSSMLIRPKVGTYTFLAELIWDVEIKGESTFQNKQQPKKQHTCGSCIKCQSYCPTNAIVADYVVDARKCISYLNIEKRGSFNEQERKALGSWIFGCDVCQEVCPFNKNTPEAVVFKNFNPTLGVGPLLSIENILNIKTDGEFKKKFANTALLRVKREGLIRNALAVSINQNNHKYLKIVKENLLTDSSLLVRTEAANYINYFTK